MATKLKIATFNLENFDESRGEDEPTLEQRIELMRPQLLRLEADVLCLQEVHAQGERGERTFSALEALLDGTPYAGYGRATTTLAEGDDPYAQRNLLTLSRYEIAGSEQYKHEFAPPPAYRLVTNGSKGGSEKDEAKELTWERPILHSRINLPGGTGGRELDVLNVHLKSKRPTDIPEQKKDPYTWKTASSWAEGYFLSSIKRVGQALEVRMLIDSLFDEADEAEDTEKPLIVCAGDFNAEFDDVPLKAIRGDVEETGNGELASRVMVPCEKSIPASARYSLYYLGQGEMIDHILMSRSLLANYRGAEVHNELLHDESAAFATDEKYPESDHAPVVAFFELPEG